MKEVFDGKGGSIYEDCHCEALCMCECWPEMDNQWVAYAPAQDIGIGLAVFECYAH